MAVALFVVFLTIFATTAGVTLLGVMGKVSIRDKYLRVLVGAFLLELSAPVIALYQDVDFFGASATDFIEGLPSAVKSDSVDLVAQNISDLA